MTQTNQKKKPMRPMILIGPGRLSFPDLAEPVKNDQGKLVWRATLLLPPTYNFKPLQDELQAAWEEEFGKDPKGWPQGKAVTRPEDKIRRAEEKAKFAGYEAGWHFVSTSADRKPGVVDNLRQDIPADKIFEEAYAGRWARLAVRAFAFPTYNKGVTLSLVHVQLLKHDTKFGGPPPPKDVFDDVVEDVDDDELI